MNKIIDGRYGIRMETIHMVRLRPVWNGMRLTGHHWRLYVHDAPGAGVMVNGEKLELSPGFAWLLPPHGDLPAWCENPALNQLYLHFEVARLTGSRRAPASAVPLDPVLAALARELKEQLDSQAPALILTATALAAAALARLPGDAWDELGPDREIEELCESLRHTLAQELTVTDLARRFGMPVNAFIRRFQAGTGSTPYQYLTNLRYTRAARLLEEGELSIDDICEAVGVKDRFHFSRMFKRLHGLSPAAYRRGYRPR